MMRFAAEASVRNSSCPEARTPEKLKPVFAVRAWYLRGARSSFGT